MLTKFHDFEWENPWPMLCNGPRHTHYHILCLITVWNAPIASFINLMVQVKSICYTQGSYTMTLKKFQDFSRTFKDPFCNFPGPKITNWRQIFIETTHHEFYFMNKDSKRCCDTTTPESIHTKDESKRGSAFAFIFGVNWSVQLMWRNDKFHGILARCSWAAA